MTTVGVRPPASPFGYPNPQLLDFATARLFVFIDILALFPHFRRQQDRFHAKAQSWERSQSRTTPAPPHARRGLRIGSIGHELKRWGEAEQEGTHKAARTFHRHFSILAYVFPIVKRQQVRFREFRGRWGVRKQSPLEGSNQPLTRPAPLGKGPLLHQATADCLLPTAIFSPFPALPRRTPFLCP